MIHIIPPQAWTLDEKIQHYILLILKVSVALAIGWALAHGHWEAFGLSSLALLLMFLPEFIESRVRITLPIEFDVVLVLFIYASMFLGEVVDAYERFWWWDAVLHISSGFILGFAGFLMLYVQLRRKRIAASPFVIGLIIFSFGVAFGTIWEIFEFAVDQIFGTNMQKNGLNDTMWDLIVDSLGALAMGIIGAQFIRKDGKSLLARWVHGFIKANPRLEQDQSGGSQAHHRN